MKDSFSLSCTIVLLVLCLPFVISNCVWYGKCHESDSKIYNCPNDGPGKILNNSTYEEILKRRCPEFFTNGSDSAVCCDGGQLQALDDNILMAEGIFGRCRTCTNNLLRVICAFTCSTNQSTFMTRYEEDIPFGSGKYIKEVDIRVNGDYLQRVYDSCKQVINPSTGKLSMSLACGSHGSEFCNPTRWFEFMGWYNNPFVPFQMNYIPTEAPDTRFDYETIHCNEAYADSYACACVDCKESCLLSSEIAEVKDGFVIATLNGVSFIVGLVVGFIGIAAVTFTHFFRRTFTVFRVPSVLGGFNEVNINLSSGFAWWGKKFANNPVFTLAVVSWIVIALGYGAFSMVIVTDPVELWSAPNSRARTEKQYFDSRFGPFYRTEQIFLKPYDKSNFYHNTSAGVLEFGPAFKKEFLLEVFALQQQIEQIGQDEEGGGLENICFAPMVAVGLKTKLIQCTIQSIFGYFGNDLNKFNKTSNSNGYVVNYLNTIDDCTGNAYSVECLAPYGGPVDSGIAIGEYDNFNAYEKPDYRLAKGLAITFLVNNKLDKSELGPAKEWERKYISFMKNYSNDMFDVAFSAERSIEDGIKELSEGEAPTVVISYAVMFIYISIALGKYKSFSRLFLDSKITLAVGGITLVLASVVCSLGIFSYIGVETTMLTIEVIPFLVLAIGVDNIFILVHTYNRLDKSQYSEIGDGIGEALGQIGPSILLTAASECCCFAIGSLSDMPAVNTFALYSTVAVFFDFMFQITAFVALMALDQKRYEKKRLDIFCCIKQTETKANDINNDASHGIIQIFVEKYYRKFLLSNTTRPIVLACFIVITCISIMVAPSVELGLDQELSMAKDSYVIKYFKFMADILSMGPPVYWVLAAGLDFSKIEDQNLVCSGVLCDENSITTQLYLQSTRPDITRIVRAPSSWLDDYFDWLGVITCCKYYIETDEFCPSDSDNASCTPCNPEMQLNNFRPTEETFKKYMTFYLSDIPVPQCAKAGKAAYSSGLNYILDENGEAYVQDSTFMGYHTTVVKSKEFYTALAKAREIGDQIQATLDAKRPGLKFFPYSIFYVFYEQYLTIWKDALISLSLSLAAIFVVTFFVTGLDIVSALFVLIFVLIILLNMFGLMWLWNITLNAVSLVNLVVSVGIGVEFISHIVRSYTNFAGTPFERAGESLSTTGSSVLSGITLTKFAGIVVLAFAKSQIFQVFYFRMYLGIVLIGAAVGLILLPVVLSYIGPPSKVRTNIY